MGEAVETLEGWYVLHDFRRIDWSLLRQWPESVRQETVAELVELAQSWASAESPDWGSTGLYTIIGHKADLLFLNLAPSLEELAARERELNKKRGAAVLTQTSSYFSVVELSKYLAQGDPDPKTNPSLRSRLQPRLPAMRNICFYPMTKRREGADNWYMLSKDERRTLMKSHGMIGHQYHERVIQLITGSQGLDDWEWGVTLFADDPVLFKKLVYEMRFDEASARFADFGPFLVGTRIRPAELSDLLDF